MSSWSGQVFRVKTRCPTPYSGRPRIEAGKVNATPHNPVPYERHQGSHGDRSLARILRHLISQSFSIPFMAVGALAWA